MTDMYNAFGGTLSLTQSTIKALSITTASVTKHISHRAAAAPGPKVRRECPMT